MKTWIHILAIVGVSHGALAASVSESCKKQLQDKAIQSEVKYISNKKQSLAGELQATFSENKNSIFIYLVDDVDGRSVIYKAQATDELKQSCAIKLARDNEKACRYSAYEGEDNLEKIPGFKLDQNKNITAENATKVESAQIIAMLTPGYGKGTLKELIEQTDEQEILRYDVTTSENKKLVYYKYYAGDTAVGSFYVGSSTKSAGENNDGDICIK